MISQHNKYYYYLFNNYSKNVSLEYLPAVHVQYLFFPFKVSAPFVIYLKIYLCHQKKCLIVFTINDN